MIDTIIRFLYYILFFFTPLVMSSATSELFEFNKMIFIYTISIFVLFFWLLKMILLKKIILKKTVFDIPILIFLLSQILSTIFSIDHHTSLYGYYGRFNGGLFSLLAYLILYFGFVSNINYSKSKFIKKLLKISLISTLIVIFWGLPGKFGYDLSCFVFTGRLDNTCWTDQFRPAERMFSTLGQPNWLGAYLAINFFISLYFIFKNEKKSSLLSQFLTFSISFLIFSSILFTRSRSALLAVFFGFLIFAFFKIISSFKKSSFADISKKLLVLFLGLLILIVFFKTGIEKVDRYLIRSNINPPAGGQISNINIKDKNSDKKSVVSSKVTDSFDIRKIVWQGAIELGKKYPLFGTGVETFAYSYYFVRPIAHNYTSEWDYLYNKAHNEYLNYLATTGFIGLGSYLMMIASILFLGIKKISNIQIKNQKERYKDETDHQLIILCLVLSYISILITNFFGFSTTTVNLFFYLIPAILVILTYKKEEVLSEKPASYQFSVDQLLYAAGVILIVFFLIASVFNYLLADIHYARADLLAKSGDYQSAARFLTTALKYRYEHIYEDKLSHILANLSVAASYQKQSDMAKNLKILAENYNTKALRSSPKNVIYWKTKAKNQYLFYQISLNKEDLLEGVKALEEAKKLSPTDPKIFYSLSIFRSLLFDDEKDPKQKQMYKNQSLEDIETAIKLKSDLRESYFLKGQLLKKYAEKEKARQVFEYLLKNFDPNDVNVKKEMESL